MSASVHSSKKIVTGKLNNKISNRIYIEMLIPLNYCKSVLPFLLFAIVYSAKVKEQFEQNRFRFMEPG